MDEPAAWLEGREGVSHSLQLSVLSLLADKQGGGGRRVSCMFVRGEWASESDKRWREKKSARQQL